MPIAPLLSPDTAPLKRLTLSRVRLTRHAPYTTLALDGQTETVLYPLTGAVQVRIDGVGYGSLGGRQSLRSGCPQQFQPVPNVIRLPLHGSGWHCQFLLTTDAADLLVLSKRFDVAEDALVQSATSRAFFQQDDITVNPVGMGTHFRTVVDVATPPGFTIRCGETENIPGGWSSWPPHAGADRLDEAGEHEEVFYVLCEKTGIIALQGRYCTGEEAEGVYLIENEQALVTPLGAHPVVFAPESWGMYVWMFSSFMEKEYRTYAGDLGTYRK